MLDDPVPRLNAALSGRYRVERELGEGGMATVFLAEDLRHQRKVALKVLKPELAAVVGAERFLAEIRTTANLQHPHILPLFDSGEADGFLFYVMPYVEGETLADRLTREGQLPVAEAVSIARKVATALQAAHEQGVVHRDIKPANILLARSEPLVSDFGIALAVGAAGGGRLTETGLTLGTPHYMSPEQATGERHVGPASDIWALGCVLYEALVGEPPYTGRTAQAILGKIITGDVEPASARRRATPPNVEAALAKALEKLPADRFASAAEMATALEDPEFRYGPSTAAVTSRRGAVAVLGVLSTALAVLAVWGWAGRGPSLSEPGVTRLTAALPPDHRISLPEWNVFPLALSPDGRTLAYVGESVTGTQLYVRSLSSFASTALEGTAGATQPFFSPDGSQLGYFAGGSLNRMSVAGGAPIRVARVTALPVGGAWTSDDEIVFASDSVLWRVDAAGGDPERVPWDAPAPPEWPTLLPGGAGGWKTPSVLVRAGREMYAVSVADGEARSLGIRADGNAVYAGGFLLYAETSGVVRAVPFDLVELRATGTAASVLEDVLRPNLTDAAVFTVSQSGALAYLPGTSARRLVLVDRTGRETPLGFTPGAYRTVSVSPDGNRALVERRGEPRRLIDLVSGADNALSRGLGGAWSPDGREVATTAGSTLLRFPVYPGAPEGAVSHPVPFQSPPMNWGNDGVVVLFTFDRSVERQGGIFSVDIDEDGAAATVLLDTDANERLVTRSPDGRWIAYTSDASGSDEIYVRAFRGGDPRLVSVNGGDRAVFSRDGRELFYMSGERMYSVPTALFDEESRIEPELLFTGSYVHLSASWDVRPQGDFLMVSAGPSWLREILVVENWTTELEGLFADQR